MSAMENNKSRCSKACDAFSGCAAPCQALSTGDPVVCCVVVVGCGICVLGAGLYVCLRHLICGDKTTAEPTAAPQQAELVRPLLNDLNAVKADGAIARDSAEVADPEFI